MAQKYSTVLFDFDGCIADTLPVWLKSFRTTFDEMGIEISDRDIIDKAFHGWSTESDIKIPDEELFDKRLSENFETESKHIQLHEGFIESIQTIRDRGIKTAIITSSLRKTVDAKLAQLDIANYFDLTLAWEDTEKNKPDPDPLLKAMRLLEASPTETLMIGDNGVDILAGQHAEVTSVWFYPLSNHLFYPESMFAHLKPHHTISKFDELITIITQ